MKSKLLVAYTMRQYASLLLSVASVDMGCSSISAFLELLDVIKKKHNTSIIGGNKRNEEGKRV